MQRCIKCDWCDTCDECSAPDRCQRQRVLSPTLSPSLLHSPYYWNIGRILYVSMLHHHEYPSQGTSLVRLQVARYVAQVARYVVGTSSGRKVRRSGRKVRRWYVFRSQGTSLVCLQVTRYVVGTPPGHKVRRWYAFRSQGTSLDTHHAVQRTSSPAKPQVSGSTVPLILLCRSTLWQRIRFPGAE